MFNSINLSNKEQEKLRECACASKAKNANKLLNNNALKTMAGARALSLSSNERIVSKL